MTPTAPTNETGVIRPGALLAVVVVGAAALWWVTGPGLVDDATPASGLDTTATIERVIDGDTVVLDDGQRVRVLGIDSPELARDGRPAECGAEAAREAAAQLVEGEQVVLTADPSQADADRFGRLLRYVTNTDHVDLSAELLEQGHASVYEPAGAVQRQEDYLQAEQRAREAGAGLWSC